LIFTYLFSVCFICGIHCDHLLLFLRTVFDGGNTLYVINTSVHRRQQ